MTERDQGTDERRSLPARVWRSIFRGPVVPRTDQERKWVVFNTLVLHVRPIRVPASTLRFTHTFGLGGSCLVLFLLLVATGLLMMFLYVPSPERAYDSVVGLENDVVFGSLVRGVHHWSANLLVVFAALHMLRVFLTGGFQGPRQFNWIVGLCLLLWVLAANFTGYLLPWDQLSYWAITISTGMVTYLPGAGPGLREVVRGGDEIGAQTLINFYALHTTFLPILFLSFGAWHFWRVRKAKGVVRPRRADGTPVGPEGNVLFLPNLLLREVAMALALLAGVVVLATLLGAPLGERANPGMSPNPAKAPWYFVGFQELLLHLHPFFAVCVIPLCAAAALALLPFLRSDEDQTGIWLRSARGRRLAAWAAGLGLLLGVGGVLVDELVLLGGQAADASGAFVARGVVPFALLVAGLALLFRFLRRRRGATRDEAVLGIFILLAVVFVALTVIGYGFRGEGMALRWP
ncbi:MAG: cytochrome b N-terminal domain-containing protein [Planctomycetota bacterium]